MLVKGGTGHQPLNLRYGGALHLTENYGKYDLVSINLTQKYFQNTNK